MTDLLEQFKTELKGAKIGQKVNLRISVKEPKAPWAERASYEAVGRIDHHSKVGTNPHMLIRLVDGAPKGLGFPQVTVEELVAGFHFYCMDHGSEIEIQALSLVVEEEKGDAGDSDNAESPSGDHEEGSGQVPDVSEPEEPELG